MVGLAPTFTDDANLGTERHSVRPHPRSGRARIVLPAKQAAPRNTAHIHVPEVIGTCRAISPGLEPGSEVSASYPWERIGIPLITAPRYRPGRTILGTTMFVVSAGMGVEPIFKDGALSPALPSWHTPACVAYGMASADVARVSFKAIPRDHPCDPLSTYLPESVGDIRQGDSSSISCDTS